jgi:hypothetical protein
MSVPNFNSLYGGAAVEISAMKSLSERTLVKKNKSHGCGCISKTKNKNLEPKTSEARIVNIAQKKMPNYEELWQEPRK